MSVRSSLYFRRGGGTKVAIEDMRFSTGQRLFVHNTLGTDSAGSGWSPDTPLKTLDYAIGLCTANKGDIIYLMPGHAETIGSATGAVMDVAGVQVIGIGNGRLKPQLTIATATTATISITAANCLIENVDIVTNFLNVAAAVTVAATADGLTLRKVNFYDTSVILGALIGISVAAGVADMTLDQVNYYGLALTAAATNAVLCAGAVDRLVVKDCYFRGDFSDGVFVATAAASAQIQLLRVIEINMSETGKGVNLHASTTGAAHEVMAYLEDQTGNEPAITGAALFMTDRVRQTNVVTASPYLCIAADS